jgi:hypothetical protein
VVAGRHLKATPAPAIAPRLKSPMVDARSRIRERAPENVPFHTVDSGG